MQTAETLDPPPSFTERASWWLVSALLHAGTLALAAVMTLNIDTPKDDLTLVLQGDYTFRETLEKPLEFDTPLPVPRELSDLNDAEVLGEWNSKALEVALNATDVDARLQQQEAPVSQEPFVPSAAPDPDELIGIGNSDLIAGALEHYSSTLVSPLFSDSKTATIINYHRIRRIGCYSCNLKDTSFAGFEWLKRNQDPNGHWSAQTHGATYKNDTAVTALGLLAFLAAGHTERHGSYKPTVQQAVNWLISRQSAEGLIWDESDDGAAHRARGYPNAIAALALIEAGGMSNNPSTRAAAQKAVDYICQSQDADGGWRYAPGMAGDLSVTGWHILALKSAKVCKYNVPASAFERAIAFLDSVEAKEAVRPDGSVPSRYKYTTKDEHRTSAHRLTAIGVLSRQFLGWKADELSASVDAMIQAGGLPTYGPNGQGVDLYYWYYATLVCFQQSRTQFEHWQAWSAAMKPAVIERQREDGPERGSWDPAGVYSNEWGRVGQTALNILLLATRYRYELMAP